MEERICAIWINHVAEYGKDGGYGAGGASGQIKFCVSCRGQFQFEAQCASPQFVHGALVFVTALRHSVRDIAVQIPVYRCVLNTPINRRAGACVKSKCVNYVVAQSVNHVALDMIAAALPDAAKPYCCFSDKLIELQKELCRQLWTHANPYTGLAYCDDPVFVLTEIVNESDLFCEKHPMKAEPYCSEFRAKLAAWLEATGIDRRAEDFDLADYRDETLIDFKIELQEHYYRTMMDCIRSSGVKIPITGTN